MYIYFNQKLNFDKYIYFYLQKMKMDKQEPEENPTPSAIEDENKVLIPPLDIKKIIDVLATKVAINGD